MSNQRGQFRGVTGIQHAVDILMHCVRGQDPKHSRKLQRGKVHRVRHVYHVCSVARIRAALFRPKNRLSGEESFYINLGKLIGKQTN